MAKRNPWLTFFKPNLGLILNLKMCVVENDQIHFTDLAWKLSMVKSHIFRKKLSFYAYYQEFSALCIWFT